MIDLIKQFEGDPAAYSAAPAGLSTAAAALDSDMIWQRIEAYTAWRFTEREVVWTIVGDGGNQFNPRLTPVVSHVDHVWREEAWVSLTLLDGPLGICLPYDGTFKVTAQVGSGDVPAPFSEAYRRLAEYLSDDPGTAGASSTSVAIGPIQEELQRNPNWVAKAMQHSGAGDLLRPYRRA